MRAPGTRFALAALAVLVLVPAGCGGTEQDAGGPGAEGAAGPLTLGRPAVTSFVDYGTRRAKQPTKVGVRVLSVRRGRKADLAPFKLSREERRSVPYYVTARFENLGRFPLSRNLLRASLEDTEGKEHRPATLVLLGGTFRPCPETPRRTLPPGASFTACSPILLPEGVEPGRARFQGDVAKDPVFWELRS